MHTYTYAHMLHVYLFIIHPYIGSPRLAAGFHFERPISKDSTKEPFSVWMPQHPTRYEGPYYHAILYSKKPRLVKGPENRYGSACTLKFLHVNLKHHIWRTLKLHSLNPPKQSQRVMNTEPPHPVKSLTKPANLQHM